ncbi:hypothetical protein SAMN05421741_11328 [Paenimyroides ummariense]|uniref:Uncharacterized protein n=1 Tax=Paenimyroides ummariense TaxID=913024 RepID=A0A1I5CRC8_9FLAO|nr:hypothetical protein [Paenimyroides ummariense]SFN89477.1 hypothetical protein SAMN05421741_11328 [Paenimyroides ummariense]
MNYILLTFISFLSSFSAQAQNIEILSSDNTEFKVKLTDGKNMSVPIERYRITGDDISLHDYFVYRNGDKIGKYNQRRLKLENGEKFKFRIQGNEVILTDNNRNVVTGELIFDEKYNYLKTIKITDNKSADKQIAESWLVLKVVHHLQPDQNNNDFIHGLIIGTAIGN